MGLMAILLTMIAQIFFQASQSFRLASASVESHRNARATLDVMLRDFTAARLVDYGSAPSTGIFRYQLLTDPASDAGLPQVPSITFTTTAGQPGAKPYSSLDSRVALVRYTLEWTGAQSDIPDESSTAIPTPKIRVPVYTLVKKVIIPNLSDDIAAYSWADANKVTSEPLAFNVLAMDIRTYQKSGLGVPGWTDEPLPSDSTPPAADYTDDFDPLPYMIEITLKMADKHIIKINTFTERFYLPSSRE